MGDGEWAQTKPCECNELEYNTKFCTFIKSKIWGKCRIGR